MSQPLQGLRVVITRAEDRGDSLAARLRELGAELISYPVIAYARPEDEKALDAALSQLESGEFDWLVLTSATSSRVVGTRSASSAPSTDWLRTKIAVVGPATAKACIELLGRVPDAIPNIYTAEALAHTMGDLHGQRILLLNADIAQPALQHALQAAGATITHAIAYRTVPANDHSIDMPTLLRARVVHAILFTSGSTVRFFVERVGAELLDVLSKVHSVCIGPNTAAVARNMGLQRVVVANAATEAGLIEALVEIVKRREA